MRVRTQLALVLSGLSGLIAAILVAAYFNGARALVFEQFRSQVLSIAATAAPGIDVEAHERLRGPADEATADYARVQGQLRGILEANRRDDVEVRFVYTARPEADGRWVYVADAELDGPDHSPVGSPVEIVAGEPLRLGEAYAEKGFSTDEFGTWLTANAPLRDATGRPVAMLGVDLRADDVLAQLHLLLSAGIFAGTVAFCAGLGGGLLVARWFTAPLERIGAAVQRIGAGDFDARVEMSRRDEFGELADAVNRMGLALRERDALRGALVRYVSREIADEVLSAKGLPLLTGARREITVLIVDIRNFTALSGRLAPEDVVRFLNAFLARMIDVIFTHRGTLDKFLGDGCLAIFGAPLDDPDHRANAVRAALAMRAAAAELGADLQARHGIELRIGIGVHTGEAIVGNIGSDQRMEYTAIGDTVNVASRLEALNKEHGTTFLASEAVVQGLGPEFSFREVAEVIPRGVGRSMHLFTFADEHAGNLA